MSVGLEAMQRQARINGMCGELSSDGQWICAKAPGHEDSHGDERWPGKIDPEIDRVKAADAEAEAAWRRLNDEEYLMTQNGPTPAALIAIAAELRAQRIARRPGAGQT